MKLVMILRFLFSTMLAALLGVLLSGCVMVTGGSGDGTVANNQQQQQPRPAATTEPAAEKSLVISAESAHELDPTAKFLLGIEREVQDDYPHLREKRIGFITHKDAIDTRGRHSLEYFIGNERFTVTRVGLIDDGTGASNDLVDRALGAPGEVALFEFNADSFKPAKAFYDGLDMVVFDAPLPGPRYAVEAAVLGAALEGAALNNIQVLLLDRPLLGNNNLVEGPTTDPQTVGSRIAFLPVPVYPGMTPGELALLYNGHFGIQGDLRVIEMSNWKRSEGSDWLRGEPLWQIDRQGRENLAKISGENRMIPGYVGLKSAIDMAQAEDWEIATIREENGEIRLILRAVKVDPDVVAERLRRYAPAGVQVLDDTVTLSVGEVPAVAIAPTTPKDIRPVELSLALRYAAVPDPAAYPLLDTRGLYGTTWMFEGLNRGLSPADLARSWQLAPAYKTFIDKRREVLRYEP